MLGMVSPAFPKMEEQNIVSISSNMLGLLASRLWVLCSVK
jgi:hypothetical protein